MTRRCRFDGCGRGAVELGLCRKHFALADEYDLLDQLREDEAARKSLTPYKFIEANVAHEGDACLTWPYSIRDDGYGQLRIGDAVVKAHRVMCKLAHGEPPFADALTAHSCGNGHLGCVNPKHLRWATAQENDAEKTEHRLRGVGRWAAPEYRERVMRRRRA